MLLVASNIFYGWWDWRFLTLIWITILTDYFVSRAIHRTASPGRRKRLLCISLVVDLGILGLFKYYDFFIGSLDRLFQSLGLRLDIPLMQLILPVGVSFYTFQTLSYTIDVYRGRTKPAGRLLDLALYVCFFPQLVAGPIERSERLLTQVINPRTHRPGDFREGLYHVMIGLFKKVVIADNVAPMVDLIFSTSTNQLTGGECLIGVYAFALQIYGDFSGYSSIAQGVAKWFGFDLMYNFRMPYFSQTPSEFWRRWHISLSTWLRDYLYIPLGGNRGNTFSTYRNLMITMLLGGLWHGAAWTFVAWGVFHGLMLCAYRPFEKDRNAPPTRSRLLRLLKIAVMFHLVCFSWLLFRADSITQAWEMFRLIVTDLRITPLAVSILASVLFYAGPVLLLETWLFFADDMLKLTRVRWYWRGLVYTYFVMMITLFPPPVANAFIYFRF
ncbi:MAG TPA: MBOAT family O-acyltransferase [Phycisphaerae bacterium]|nr:MBOAT family O-acyltransferase [Phycisphaerae bacterium]